jgi:hypothetical protein
MERGAGVANTGDKVEIGKTESGDKKPAIGSRMSETKMNFYFLLWFVGSSISAF